MDQIPISDKKKEKISSIIHLAYVLCLYGTDTSIPDVRELASKPEKELESILKKYEQRERKLRPKLIKY
ncbi:MAG: hypothetical protein DRJ38_03405 [Thermoprotei archaeon]|nr:MAG: hypothetical protein DRJ38_03405 [Thermoprotei archaeon]